jgi:glycosyltransferase involved in cell wall biosynthesis
MKLVQTLVVRDEADIVDAQLSYHLNAGVDFVIASDHASRDGTTEILESYARDGVLRRIPVTGDMHDGPWRTRMARLAATEHGADWVINTDADEFWMPRAGALKEVFAAVREPWGVVFALSRHFVPRPAELNFAERMTVRVSPSVAINDPTSPYRPHLKAAHRADAWITISHGAHSAFSRRWRALHNWHPADVLHFPFRSMAQWESKGVRRARGDSPLGQYVTALLASERGRAADRYRALVVDDAVLERGCADGSLTVDVRLRDTLRDRRDRRAARSGASFEPALLSDATAARDADVVRLQRFLDGLNARLGALDDRRRRVRRSRLGDR